jgi:mRNA-degrading endonuclease RelE of RelBE toxin-antitoxin system
MNYNIEATPHFASEVKKLSKKYPSLKKDITSLASQLSINPLMGVSLGNNFYKIRLAISSKGRGKSGGARIITCVKITNTIVYLATIYDKSEKENITDKEIKELAKQIK